MPRFSGAKFEFIPRPPNAYFRGNCWAEKAFRTAALELSSWSPDGARMEHGSNEGKYVATLRLYRPATGEIAEHVAMCDSLGRITTLT